MAGWHLSVSLSDLPNQRQLRHMQRMLSGAFSEKPASAVLHRLLRSEFLKAAGLRCMTLQVGEHLQHDYSMYFSDAGGCCDCGDSAAWKPSGFCQRHSGQGTQEPLTLEPLEAVTLEAVLSWAVYQLCCALKACIHGVSLLRLHLSSHAFVQQLQHLLLFSNVWCHTHANSCAYGGHCQQLLSPYSVSM